MSSPLFGKWVLDPSLSAFAPECPDAEMEYWALACSCGGRVLRVSGRPRATRGTGSYFWRSVARVWREARVRTEGGELLESPFMLPLWLRCERCGDESPILRTVAEGGVPLEGDGVASRDEREEPREAFRCRACRRGGVDLVVGVCAPEGFEADSAHERTSDAPLAAEVLVRCRACDHKARIAWFDRRPSEQEVRLDLLYGRR